MRRGLLGGTFNPPHIGHLVCAQEALGTLGLDRVTFLVAAVPPHKEVPGDPGPEVRLALCRAAVAQDERFDVSDLELRRPGPSYTVDTLRELHEEAPRDELTFIVGGDMAFAFPDWCSPAEILRLARLGVAEREEVKRADIARKLSEALPGSESRVDFFGMPRIDVSSSALRARAADGRSLRYLVPPGVESEIERRRLYGR